MRARVADLLGVDIDQVSIKAKTPEGLNLDRADAFWSALADLRAAARA